MPKTKVIYGKDKQPTALWDTPALHYPKRDDEHDARPNAKVIHSEDALDLQPWDTPSLRVKREQDLEAQANTMVLHKDENWSASPWETPHLDHPVVESNRTEEFVEEDPEEELKLPTAEEIEQIQKQAYDEAYQKGYEEGNSQGVKDGLEQGKKTGYEEGLEQGRAQGQQEGISLVKEKANSFDAILSKLYKPLEELDSVVEQQISALAITIAKQLIRRELRTDPGQVVHAVKQAVSVLPASERQVRVFLNPKDASLVRDVLSLDDAQEQEIRWQLIEDPALTRGGCIVEAADSRVDATVESRMAAIITQTLGGEREGDGV